MIKAAKNFNFEEEMPSQKRGHPICHGMISFPDGSGIFIKTQDNPTERDQSDSHSMQIEESSEYSNEELSSNLTREEWETVLTLNSLEYLIVIRSSKRMRKSRKQHTSFKVLDSKSKEKNGGIVQKRKRSSPLKADSHKCPNCLTTDSALWRNCVIKGKSHHFCNACGLRFKKGKFCPLCYKVYYDVDTNTRDWKQCSHCFNWTHQQCLSETGKDTEGSYTCNLCHHE